MSATDWTTCTVNDVVHAYHLPCRGVFIVPQEHDCRAYSGAPAPAPPSEPLHRTFSAAFILSEFRAYQADDCRDPTFRDCASHYIESLLSEVATLTARLAETEREREALQQQVHEGKTTNGQPQAPELSRDAPSGCSCMAWQDSFVHLRPRATGVPLRYCPWCGTGLTTPPSGSLAP